VGPRWEALHEVGGAAGPGGIFDEQGPDSGNHGVRGRRFFDGGAELRFEMGESGANPGEGVGVAGGGGDGLGVVRERARESAVECAERFG
jgi:hypothetical protein